MKYRLNIFLFILLPFFGNAQQHLPDSTVQFLRQASNDSVHYRACLQAYNFFEERNRDSALYYAEQALLLTRRNNIKLQEVVSLDRKGYQLSAMGRYAEALPCFLQAFEIAEVHRNESNSWFTVVLTPEKSRLLALSFTHHMYAILMGYTQNIEQSIFHNKEAKKNAQGIEGLAGKLRILLANMNLGAAYVELNKTDSAVFYLIQARELALKSDQKKYLGFILVNFGDVSLIEGDKEKAKQYYYEALQSAIEEDNISTLSKVYFKLSRYYTDEHVKDSSLLYALKMQEALKALGPVISTEINIGAAYDVLYRSYDLRQQPDSALKYANLSLLVKDSIHKKRIASLAEFQSLSLVEQQRLQVLEKEKEAYQNKIRTYFLLAGIGVLLLLAIIFYRNNRQKHKAKIKIEQAYDNLKATQQQLTQSEKMASLGELTAGIAHEIQNPLNFVNNFSEVNKEMLAEMREEIEKKNFDEVSSIAKDVEENEEKIIFHGKRADAIVKGMLQHSRRSSGVKEPTDINALADEYLRLAYHGLRAKDKSFNATMKTDFDESIGNINIVPQDIGRVILNIIINAFYAVTEKKKQIGEDYEPTVAVRTSKNPPSGGRGAEVLISVSDNGNGIPQKVLDKIFQPFFTTKPTGQGTGLGLSLAYDIVKSHGGELNVETKEGVGSTFIITIPNNS